MARFALMIVLALLACAPTASASLILASWGDFNRATILGNDPAEFGTGAFGELTIGDPEVWAFLPITTAEDDPVNGYWIQISFHADTVTTWGDPLYDSYGDLASSYTYFSASGTWYLGLTTAADDAAGVIERGTFEVSGQWYVPGYARYAHVLYTGTAIADPGALEVPGGLGPIDFSDWFLTIEGFYSLEVGHPTTLYADPKPTDVVPEPTTIALLGAGLVLVAVRGMKGQKT